MWIIQQGMVDILIDENRVRTVTRLDYLGERNILFDTPRSATLIARGHTICWEISKEGFLAVLDPNRKAILLKRIEFQDDYVMLEHLQVVRTLGQGMFGNVFLCVSKSNGRKYALKAISNNKIRHY